MNAELAQFRWLLFASGSFNIVLAAPLAVPHLAGPYLALLWDINQMLGLPGAPPVVPPPGVGAMLANTAGIDLVLIGTLVIYAGLDPLRRRFIIVANAIGRVIFALLIVYYVITANLAILVLIIGFIDLAISAGFVHFLIRLRRH